MVLSERLKASAKYLKGFNCLADCGTDHGYLPIYAVKNNLVKKAIASDNKKYPLDNAKKNIHLDNLDSKIQTILADGLPYLNPEIDLVSILGMGGRLIADILDSANIADVKRFVFAPNSESAVLRSFLMEHHFRIVAEEIVKDNKKFYQIIVAEPGMMTLDDLELEFGPIILKDNTPIFKEFIRKLINQLTEALPRIKQLDEQKKIDTRINILKEAIHECS